MNLSLLAGAAAMLAASAGARAQEVTIGFGAAITAVDPHFQAVTSNNAIAQHIFEALVHRDENLGLVPGLAESWRTIDDTTWEFKLRRGVKWHDGSEFTADDVTFSYARINERPGQYTIYTKPMVEVKVVDPYTLHIKSAGVYPLMPHSASGAFVVSKKVVTGLSTGDFNTGKAAVGTGPYRLVSYTPGDRIELTRNDAYWGPKEPWQTVKFRFITSTPTRMAALLAGDVQVIDAVPPDDVAALGKNPNIVIASAPGVRNIFLYLDQLRDEPPGVLDNAGGKLPKNPFKDLRVRRALSLAINREGITRTIMSGQASPSGQFLPAGMIGVPADIKPDPFDVNEARKLLEAAGYRDGFQVAIGTPNDRYINDEKVVLAVAQMWSRIGVKAKVEAMPAAVIFPRFTKQEFGIGLLGWGTGSGEPDSPLTAIVATSKPEKGWGTANRSQYSNPEFDQIMERAVATIDPRQRAQLYEQATRIAMKDQVIIPLHHQVNIWALRKGLMYKPRNDERTLAMDLRRAP